MRRPNPQLNPRAWIVVPFTNVSKAPDVDWLRDASVNLLSMDMGRWTDVNIVPDKRVADLVRELPAAMRAEALTLNDGLAIARRAGAGMLVMGDFLRVLDVWANADPEVQPAIDRIRAALAKLDTKA